MYFTQWLRKSNLAAGILAIIRIYVGWGFLTAGWEKLTNPKGFSALGFLQHSLANPVLSPAKAVEYPWFNAFLKGFALPDVGLFNFLVPWGELLVGIGLILGTLTTAAIFFGLLMNFMYILAGAISVNPLDIFLGIFIIVAGYNAGKFGGDYFVIPQIRKLCPKRYARNAEYSTDVNNKAT